MALLKQLYFLQVFVLSSLAFNRHANNTHSISSHIVPSFPVHSKYIPLPKSSDMNPEIYISSFGGDPSGIKDSTTAFQSALNEAMSRGIVNQTLDGSIKDCGGATINLQGGIYLISAPLYTFKQHGNFRIIDGTIKASDAFKNNENSTTYLLSIYGPSQDFGIENIFLDCNNVCDGALLIADCVGAVIGPQVFMLGFNEIGIEVDGGHEVMIYNTWIGEYVWNDPRRINATATGIELNGNDHFVNDVIVWSGKIGLVNKGGANIIYGLHTYNLNTLYGGIGIINYADSVRIIGCYLDYNDLVLVAPINLVSLQDSFFLGGTTIRLEANEKNSNIQSLSIRDCQYSIGDYEGVPYTITLDESNGNKFGNIKDVHIDDAIIGGYKAGGYKIKTTKYRKKMSKKNSTVWTFDFGEILLFDTDAVPIEFVDYTFQLDKMDANTFDVRHLLLKPNGYTVTVQTNIACDATVYVTVDQSK